jgi:hypothetical protein
VRAIELAKETDALRARRKEELQHQMDIRAARVAEHASLVKLQKEAREDLYSDINAGRELVHEKLYGLNDETDNDVNAMDVGDVLTIVVSGTNPKLTIERDKEACEEALKAAVLAEMARAEYARHQ